MSTTKIAMSHRDDPLERRLLQGKIVMRTTRKGPYPSQETKHRSIWARAVYGPEWEPCRVHSPPITEANINMKKEGALKDNFIAKTRLKNSSDSKTKLFKVCFYEFNEIFNVQSIAFIFNPLTAEWALRALLDSTLSNARRFYSSMENPLDGKGLNTGRRELQYLNHLKFFFHKPEGFVARSVYNQKTR